MNKIVILCLLLLVSCSDNDTDNGMSDTNNPQNQNINICELTTRFTEVDVFDETQITETLNLNYGSAIDWQGNTTELLIDAYYPDNTIDDLDKRPAVLLIHGGSYQFGTKETWADECLEFAKKGFVAFTIKYRLGWNTSNPLDQVNAAYRANQDARAALRYIIENKDTFGVDTDWLFIGGGSAGANCALNTIYITQNEWNATLPNIEATLGSLNTSGNNLTHNFSLKGVFNNWGNIRENTMQTSELVPTIAFHGEQDTTVDIDVNIIGLAGSRAIHNTLIANNVCSDLTVNPNGGHGVYVNATGTAFRVGRASCFFKSVICDTCIPFSAEVQVPANCSI